MSANSNGVISATASRFKFRCARCAVLRRQTWTTAASLEIQTVHTSELDGKSMIADMAARETPND